MNPLTAIKLKATLRECAELAKKDEPTSIDGRARTFVAALSGSIGNYDKALGDFLFSTVLRNEGDAK